MSIKADVYSLGFDEGYDKGYEDGRQEERERWQLKLNDLKKKYEGRTDQFVLRKDDNQCSMQNSLRQERETSE